jgi:prepilin-type N-terminal cleavage/methylation domain-containing protein
MTTKVSPRACRGVCVKHLTNLIGASRGERRYNGFTLIELILVFGIIAILAGLVLTTVGYARKKGALARAETEIAAMSAACENYKADNGVYPQSGASDGLDAQANGDPTTSEYQNASLDLFTKLSGLDQNQTPIAGARNYFAFKPNMLGTSTDVNGNTIVVYIRDPFGYSYGYSTIQTASQDSTRGYNPTFDLWSTTGTISGSPSDRTQWIKNW